jgi:ankyrin repeat protein
VATCHRRDGAAARKLLDQHPGLLAHAGDLLIDAAAARDLVDLAEFLLALGVSPDAEKRDGGYRALHHAATSNSANVARLLVERGAAVDVRDRQYHATPLAWAIRAQAPATLALLSAHSRDVFSVVAGGLESRLRELLQDPTLANAVLEDAAGLGVLRGEPGETPLFVLPPDERVALDMARLLLRCGADPRRRSPAGVTAVEKARARGLHAVAELLSATT